MFKQLSLLTLTVVLGLSTVAPQAHAVDLSTALKRMDAIIEEMKSLRAEFAELASVTEVSTPVATVLGSVSGGVLGDDIAFGSTNDDIKKIQRLLATDDTIYPYGAATGFYGPKTQDAVRAFQARFDLDTVGVVGPSTRALLEVFFAAYPAGTYPADVLKKAAPKVAGVTTSKVTAPVTKTELKSLTVKEDDDEYIVRSSNNDGTRNRDLVLYADDEDDLVEAISKKLGVTEREVQKFVDEENLSFGSKSNRVDEDDADDAIEDAYDEIDKARDKIRDAETDGDDVDDADELYDDARTLYKKAKNARDDEDYADAVEYAEDAEKKAKEARRELP